MTSPITVGCAADNKFAVLAATMIKSIEICTPVDHDPTRVYLIENRISRSRLNKIIQSIDPARIDLHILTPDWNRLHTLDPISAHRQLTAYHRLLLPELLPHSTKRILYLDCDILVNKPLMPLWQTKILPHHVVAAAQDSNAWTVGCEWGGGVPNYAEFGMEKDAPYFNSGVLLIDLEKWRNQDISTHVVRINTENQSYVRWLDQYGLNVALHNKWTLLDKSWNSYPENFHSDRKIIHFVSRKPISPDYEGPFRDLFFDVLDRTQWKGHRPSNLPLPSFLPERLRYSIRQAIQPW